MSLGSYLKRFVGQTGSLSKDYESGVYNFKIKNDPTRGEGMIDKILEVGDDFVVIYNYHGGGSPGVSIDSTEEVVPLNLFTVTK